MALQYKCFELIMLLLSECNATLGKAYLTRTLLRPGSYILHLYLL